MSAVAQSTAPQRSWNDVAYKRFWHAMGEIFGLPWYNQNGPEPKSIWMSSLCELSFDRVAATLKHYRDSGDAYPPNLSVFMAKAKSLKLGKQEHVALPPPTPAGNAIAEEALAQMRKPSRKCSVLLPGEGYGDYWEALVKSGKPKEQFDNDRLIANGWKGGA